MKQEILAIDIKILENLGIDAEMLKAILNPAVVAAAYEYIKNFNILYPGGSGAEEEEKRDFRYSLNIVNARKKFIKYKEQKELNKLQSSTKGRERE